MGGGLAFLNKKTWHPSNLANVEQVWKREEEAEKERRKLEELRKQYDEERGREELQQVAAAAGHGKQSDQLDWMYSGSMASKQEADKRAEEALLGKPAELAPATEAEVTRVDQAALLPSFYAEDTPTSANETWARLHSDPLFAIRQQELSTRKRIVHNPVQMAEIRAQVVQLKAAAKADKRAKKEAKKEKKKAKKDKEGGREADAPKAPVPTAQVTNGRHRSRSPAFEKPRRSRSRSPPRQANGHSSHARHQSNGSAHHASREGHSSRRDERSSRDGRSDARGERHNREDGRSRQAEPSHADERSGEAEAGRRVHHDGASAQRPDTAYGLSYGGNAPQVVQTYDRSERAAATRQRLEEAAARREAQEAERAASRHGRQEYRPGKLSAEERAVRLAQMMGNADAHEQGRSARLSNARDASLASAAADGQGEQAADFLKAATKEVYGTLSEDTLADRVGRRKFFNDRSGNDSNAYRKG